MPVRRREGSDLTIASLGPTLYRALDAAEVLEKEHGLSVEVWDLRFVTPLNLEPIVESVKKTGRLLGAHFIGEQAATLVQQCIQMMAFEQDVREVVAKQHWIHPALPEVIGGIRVEIGDDVIDGTVASRLDDARRKLAG